MPDNLKIYTDWLFPASKFSCRGIICFKRETGFSLGINFGCWSFLQICSLPRGYVEAEAKRRGPEENKEQFCWVFLFCSDYKPYVLPPPTVCRKRCCRVPFFSCYHCPLVKGKKLIVALGRYHSPQIVLVRVLMQIYQSSIHFRGAGL